MKIIVDDLGGREVKQLLADHLRGMAAHSPPDCIHALDLEGLRAPDITFWSVWDSVELLGCGALKELNAQHGEIKSMRTAAAHLGKGVGSALVSHIIATATARGYKRLSLETGSGAAFEPAHSLYLKFGFQFCGPFADYRPGAFSRFMTISICETEGEFQECFRGNADRPFSPIANIEDCRNADALLPDHH